MKQFAAFWSGTPYWIRGMFLGNFCYIVLVVLEFSVLKHGSSDQSWVQALLTPFMLLVTRITPIDSRVILYHIGWCLLGAVFVEWFRGSKGITILAGVMYGIGVLVFLCLIVAFLWTFGS